jgi:hypothetical protein
MQISIPTAPTKPNYFQSSPECKGVSSITSVAGVLICGAIVREHISKSLQPAFQPSTIYRSDVAISIWGLSCDFRISSIRFIDTCAMLCRSRSNLQRAVCTTSQTSLLPTDEPTYSRLWIWKLTQTVICDALTVQFHIRAVARTLCPKHYF